MQENKKLKNKSIIKRSLSRLAAVQSLYQYDFHNQEKDLKTLANELLDNYLLDENNEATSSYHDKIDKDLLENLTSGIILALPAIDAEIKEFLQNKWQIETLPDVALPILRLGTFELKYMKNIPWKVVVSEYVDIAGSFYEAGKMTFINSILEKIAAKNRAEEFIKKQNV